MNINNNIDSKGKHVVDGLLLLKKKLKSLESGQRSTAIKDQETQTTQIGSNHFQSRLDAIEKQLNSLTNSVNTKSGQVTTAEPGGIPKHRHKATVKFTINDPRVQDIMVKNQLNQLSMQLEEDLNYLLEYWIILQLASNNLFFLFFSEN